jgi:hypothetical protein
VRLSTTPSKAYFQEKHSEFWGILVADSLALICDQIGEPDGEPVAKVEGSRDETDSIVTTSIPFTCFVIVADFPSVVSDSVSSVRYTRKECLLV